MADDTTLNVGDDATDQAATVKEAWSRPEIVSYKPAVSAKGFSYTPLDGISNLTV